MTSDRSTPDSSGVAVTTLAPMHVDGDVHEITPESEPVPGLHVVKLPPDLDWTSRLRWRIVHHSGRQIAAARTEHRISLAIDYMSKVTDWTRSAEDLRAAQKSGALDVRTMFDYLHNHLDVWPSKRH